MPPRPRPTGLWRAAAWLALALGAGPPALAQALASHLPIVLIETSGPVPDEPKVPGRMRVIDNARGLNRATDPPTGYDGHIGIEVRGATSQAFPKKQYALETRTAAGENRDVPLLGMPEENDWILHAPYADKTLVRNVVAYRLARAMGRYASRTRFCEVVLNGEYQGVYVLLESIKRDRSRVDVARLRPEEVSGDDLTGGYIVKVDKGAGDEQGGWLSPFPPPYAHTRRVRWQFHDPRPSEVAPEQAAYIERVVTDFEGAVLSDDFEDPERGFLPHVDLGSFVDLVIHTEVTKNIDGYRASAYLHKDKDSRDGRLRAGPVWDFNLAMGNASWGGGASHRGFQFDWDERADGEPIPFWWPRMARSRPFGEALAPRWAELRRGPLHTDSLLALVDAAVAELGDAAARDLARWGTEGRHVWGNAYVGRTHDHDVRYLKEYLRRRVGWLDRAFAGGLDPGPNAALALSPVSPAPASGDVRATLATGTAERVRVELVDALGRRARLVFEGPVEGGVRELSFSVAGLASGAYRLIASGIGGSVSRPLVVVRR